MCMMQALLLLMLPTYPLYFYFSQLNTHDALSVGSFFELLLPITHQITAIYFHLPSQEKEIAPWLNGII